MTGLTYRPLLRTDAPAILDIQLAAELAEPADEHVDLAEIEEDLQMPGLDLPNGSVAAMAGDHMVGYGNLYVPPPGDRLTVHVSVGVRPEFRRSGTGRTLLGRLIGQAKALRDKKHPDHAGELKIWVQHGRGSMAGLASAFGFTVRRYFFDMGADLHTVPTVREIPGVAIRQWTPADDESTRLAYNSAFADHWGSTPSDSQRWRKTFAESSFFRPEFSRLAVQDDRVVGFVLVDEFGSETAAHGYRTGYIDRVGTVQSVRGRGVAAALLADTMGALAAAGVARAELAVDADSPTGAGRLYQRLGFTTQRRNQVVGLDF